MVRPFLSLVILTGMLRGYGVLAAQYCYCDTKAGFRASGIQEMCPESAEGWTAINCLIGGYSDVCKYTGDGELNPKTIEAFEVWCDKQISLDSMDVTHVGGTFTCSSDLPSDTEDTPCHDSVEMPKNRKRRYAMSNLQSRQDTVPNNDIIKPADDRDIPKYLKYSASGPNLVSTEEIVHWDDQYSRMVQLNELRLLGYDWERVRGRNNKGGTQEYTETLSVTEGIERSRSSSSRVSVDFNFQVSFPYGSAGVSASAAQEFFESQKSDVVSQKTINIKVDPGHAQFIYQQVYTWETQAWFRWEVYDWSGKIRGKDSTGNWTISAKRRNVPLTAKSVSYIKTDNLVILNKALHGQGTFDVAEDWKIVEPLYPRTNLVKIAETGGREKDIFRRLGFKNEE